MRRPNDTPRGHGWLPALAMALVVAPPVMAWELDPRASHVRFIGTADGREAVTEVQDFRVDLEGSLDDPSEGSLVLTLDATSLTGGNDIVDGMLHGRNWFDVEAYPEIVYRSTSIESPSPGELRVEGELELLGDTYPLTVPATWHRDDERLSVEGRLTLDRSDFDMGRGAWRTEGTVRHEVQVDFVLELVVP